MIKYIKIIILVFLLAQANSQSKTIKFLVVNSVTGAEIKPDSVVFENCTNHSTFRLTSDSLILTEVENPTSSFTNSGADFKLKAILASNNLILDIDNISTEKVSIELYGYLGTTLYTQDISLFSGMNHSVIPLDFTNEKLLFLRVKSNNSIANVKLNRIAESCATEIRSITKPVDETLGAFPIDTAYNYNIRVYKKGYNSYYDDNISFNVLNSYTVFLFEIPKNRLLNQASCNMDGIRVETHNTSHYWSPRESGSKDYLDTSIFKSGITIINNLYPSLTRCGVGYYIFPNNYADVGSIETVSQGFSICKEIKAKINFTENTLDSICFVYCTDYSKSTTYSTNFSGLKINAPIKFILKNNKNYFRIGKDEILKLLKSNQLSLSIDNSESFSAYASGGSSCKLTQILEVADNAYIEIAFWE